MSEKPKPGVIGGYVPEIGDIFTVECTTFIDKYIQHDDTITIAREKLNSWHDTIFRMVSSDLRLIVADILHGAVKGNRVILKRTEYKFYPVGPDVIRDMGFLKTRSQ